MLGSSAGLWTKLFIAFAILLSVSCKPKTPVDSEDQSVFGDLALAAGEEVCFDEFPLLEEFITAGETEIETDTVNALLQSVEKQACSPQLTALLNNSSQDVALKPKSEGSLGLVNIKDVLKIAARIEKLGPQLRLVSSDGMSVLLKIVRRSEQDVHSNPKLLQIWRRTHPLKNSALKEFDGKLLEWVRLKHAEMNAKFNAWYNKNARVRSLFREDKVVGFLVIKADRFKIQSQDPLVQQGIKEIFNLMSSPKIIFGHLQELEIEIAKRMANGEKLEVALDNVLAAQEKLHGFRPAIDLKGDLTREYFTKPNPALFRDFAFETGSNHGRQIHRIQWYVVTKHIERTRINVKGAELFRGFGEGVVRQGTSNWAGGWNALFDNGTYDFGSPDYWRRRFTDYLPVLGRWP